MTPDPRKVLWVSCMMAAALIVVEGYRWTSKPLLILDGEEVGVVEPFPVTEYRERYLQVLKPVI